MANHWLNVMRSEDFAPRNNLMRAYRLVGLIQRLWKHQKSKSWKHLWNWNLLMYHLQASWVTTYFMYLDPPSIPPSLPAFLVLVGFWIIARVWSNGHVRSRRQAIFNKNRWWCPFVCLTRQHFKNRQDTDI